ncbi:hypothetical protein AD929_15645 [Gluconobacter potus]|uniref:Uncharacterized protein n=1 Tax=Gluconobacter potus TaxID=2724927 RepID=A0A149QPL5_9PROT|nr:hypothetical protein [Gluconobacter potus]KXU99230.1 hypothetical protein AD929_15645 [Gluconobacter potus]
MSALALADGKDFERKMCLLVTGQARWSQRLENDIRNFWGDKLCGTPNPERHLSAAAQKALVALYEAYGQSEETQRALEAA